MPSEADLIKSFALIKDVEPAISRLHESYWLSAAELETLSTFGSPVRRRLWIAGRWVAKQLILDYLGAPLDDETDLDSLLARISILSVDALGRPNRPQVLLNGRRMPGSLSLSHSDQHVFAAVASNPSARVGVDVVEMQDLGSALERCWFSSREQGLLAHASPEAALKIWTAKEACYKASHRGEAFDPHQVEVYFEGDWRGTAEFTGPTPQKCFIRWQIWGAALTATATVVA